MINAILGLALQVWMACMLIAGIFIAASGIAYGLPLIALCGGLVMALSLLSLLT